MQFLKEICEQLIQKTQLYFNVIWKLLTYQLITVNTDLHSQKER